MKEISTEFIKESVRFETEKLKLYAGLFTALVINLVSILKGIPDITSASAKDEVSLFITTIAMFGFVIVGTISLWQVKILFKLLKKKPLP